MQQIILKLVENHVFAALNRNIIKNRVEKEIRTNLVKTYSFRIQNLIYIMYFALIISDDVIQISIFRSKKILGVRRLNITISNTVF